MVKRLLLLNGLAIIAAVIHHVVAWDITTMFWWADRYRPVAVPAFDQLWSLRYIVVRVLDQFAFPGVFAFLIVSGYFVSVMAGSRGNQVGWKLVLLRTKNLLIPYLLWSFIYIVFNLAQGKDYSAGQIAWSLVTGGIAPPFYYVPLLIQLFLLAPFLAPLARQRPLMLIITVVLLQVPVTLAHYLGVAKVNMGGMEPLFTLLRDWPLLGYSPWFVLGLMLGAHMERFKSILAKIRTPLFFCLALVFVAGIAEWELVRQVSGKEWLSPQVTIGDKVFALLLLLSFFALDKLAIPFSAQISHLGTKSYGIYLIHSLVLELGARGIYHVAPWLLRLQIPYLLLLIVAGVGIPVLMMWVVERIPFTRKFYGAIFG